MDAPSWGLGLFAVLCCLMLIVFLVMTDNRRLSDMNDRSLHLNYPHRIPESIRRDGERIEAAARERAERNARAERIRARAAARSDERREITLAMLAGTDLETLLRTRMEDVVRAADHVLRLLDEHHEADIKTAERDA